MLLAQPLPYHSDSADLFEHIQHLPGAVFLDSCTHVKQLGQYDILAALPYLKIESYGQYSVINSICQDRILHTETSQQPPFTLLQSYLEREGEKYCSGALSTLPFSGGAIGCFDYNLNHAEILNKYSDSERPLMTVGFYNAFIIVDHLQKITTAYGASTHSSDSFKQLLRAVETQPESQPLFRLNDVFQPRINTRQYLRDFNAIREFILSGDCYQINYSQQFEAEYSGNPWLAYKALRQISPAPFSAFYRLDKGAVLSHSPEQFLQLRDCEITSKPIKGTRPRMDKIEADNLAKEALSKSVKDRAENLMIVDLLRNDISRNAEIGSVKVPSLFGLESYANVHHLVSTISARLAQNSDAVSLFRDCFPGGSITGAPKKRAMEIIDNLEHHQRKIYCGSIAYFSFNGNMDSSITIRTLLCEEATSNTGKIFCWGGGGIVADSKINEEYQESIDKISNLLNGLKRFL